MPQSLLLPCMSFKPDCVDVPSQLPFPRRWNLHQQRSRQSHQWVRWRGMLTRRPLIGRTRATQGSLTVCGVCLFTSALTFANVAPIVGQPLPLVRPWDPNDTLYHVFPNYLSNMWCFCIAAETARSMFMSSCLSEEVLAKVWWVFSSWLSIRSSRAICTCWRRCFWTYGGC